MFFTPKPTIETSAIGLLSSTLALILPVAALLASCSSPTQHIKGSDTANCIYTHEDKDRKTELENGIRGKVKFEEEPENFSSIYSKMSEYKIPALSLAVINHGEIEWADIYHNPDFKAIQELDCSSIFQAASLSKPVTFMAALRMHAAGKIDLDKNIQGYLKDFIIPEGKQTETNPVTLRNIFSHTSGINPGGYQGYKRDSILPSDLDILQGTKGANTPAIAVVNPPNEVLVYSGGGYTLAELTLQDIFDDEFADIMHQWILEPAGMEYSEFTQPFPDSNAYKVAKGYTASGEILEGGWRNHPEQAAAGLWSNAIDMAKFLTEIYKGYHGQSTIFSKSDIESIIAQERDGHVYGFIINRHEEDIAIMHYGGNIGYRTGMTISLTTGNGLVYLINSDNGGALGNELLLSAAQVYDWQHFEQTLLKRDEVAPNLLASLEGDYKWNSQINLTVTFDESDNRLSLFFPNGEQYRLTPIVGDALDFVHQNTGVQISFFVDNGMPSFKLYGQTAIKKDNEIGTGSD
ncbi:MAG: beta-lactamase family protein [Mameliella sp.]|nr:beta-lactamase family protein [Phaeodactylibacter sp.]